MKSTLRSGLTATLDYRVPKTRTVPHLLPESDEFGRMPSVLATGYLVGLVEWTCMRALSEHLDDGERTVGVHVDLSHEAATPPGCTVTITVELTVIHGRRLTFAVEAKDDAAILCRGTHQRAVIDLRRFEDRLAERAPGAESPA